MTIIREESWRKVEETDFHNTHGWMNEGTSEEFHHFKAFIEPYVRHQQPIAIGGIYRLWKEFRGDDSEYKLSLNDLKRLWTALSVLNPEDPLYCNIPTECIVYDETTLRLIEELRAGAMH